MSKITYTPSCDQDYADVTPMNFSGVFNGQTFESINHLLELLQSEPLCPTFEEYGFYSNATYHPMIKVRDNDAAERLKGHRYYFGNFMNISANFRFTVEPNNRLVKILDDAIAKNMLKPEYIEAARLIYSDHVIVKDVATEELRLVDEPIWQAYLRRKSGRVFRNNHFLNRSEWSLVGRRFSQPSEVL